MVLHVNHNVILRVNHDVVKHVCSARGRREGGGPAECSPVGWQALQVVGREGLADTTAYARSPSLDLDGGDVCIPGVQPVNLTNFLLRTPIHAL